MTKADLLRFKKNYLVDPFRGFHKIWAAHELDGIDIFQELMEFMQQQVWLIGFYGIKQQNMLRCDFKGFRWI